jgi:hypothetical protein
MTAMLTIRPISQRAAAAWVNATHRHLGSPRGDVIRCAVVDTTGAVRAVAMAGRPLARAYDDGVTLEVLRIASDGAENACSMLYGAIRRAAVALGYTRLITYTLPEEGGASLRAAGWRMDGETKGGSWSTPARPRDVQGVMFDAVRRRRNDPKTRWMWP